MAKILVVEDDKYLNKLISDRFSLEGFTVETALDGETAFQLLGNAKKDGSAFEILVTDMLLPKMMGAELLTKVKESQLSDGLKMVGISGVYKDPQGIKDFVQLHQLHSYWTKPFDMDELISALSGKPLAKPEKVLKGSLVEKSVEQLMLDAYTEGFTGQIQLSREGSERKIFFLNGFPVGANSTIVSESFGQSLIALGLITSEIQAEASRRMVEEGLQFGQMLLKMEALNKNQLFDGLRKHTYRLLLNSFLWRTGDFNIVPLQELPSYILPLEFNSMLLILKAHRSMFAKEFIQDLYQTKQDLYLVFKERAVQILTLLNLEAQSIDFISSIRPEEKLSDILKRMPAAAHELLLRIFYFLESLKLLSFTSTPEATQKAAAAIDFQKTFEEEQRIPKEIAEKIQSEYMELLGKNHFEILEVKMTASKAEIDEAYRTIRYRLHPDRYGPNLSGQAKRILDDMLAKIDKAYQVLSDQQSKDNYWKTLKQTQADSAADSKRFLEAQDQFREGIRLLGSQNFSSALEQFRSAAKKWPRGVEYLAYALYTQFKWAMTSKDENLANKSLNALEELCLKNPSQDVGFLLLGHMYVSQSKIPQAREAYQTALKNNERNDEASTALAGLAHVQIKKERFSRTVKEAKVRVGRLLVYLSIVAAGAGIFLKRDLFIKKEEGISTIQAIELEGIIPTLNIRQKADTAKIVVKPDWVTTVPDSVLTAKCSQALTKLKSYGILRMYLYDEKLGIKAVCYENKIRRY